MQGSFSFPKRFRAQSCMASAFIIRNTAFYVFEFIHNYSRPIDRKQAFQCQYRAQFHSHKV